MAKESEKEPLEGFEEGTLGWNVMNRETTHKIDFTVTPASSKLIKRRVRSFFRNPEKNWGPKRAAAIVIERKGTKDNKNKTEGQDSTTKKLKTD